MPKAPNPAPFAEKRVVPVSQIKAAPYNPRVALKAGDARYERLSRSIDRFGLVDTLVWNEETGNLVGGHQRLQILKDRGYTEVPVTVVKMNEDEEKALNVTLNNPDVAGEWDTEMLVDILANIENTMPDAYDELEMNSLRRLALNQAADEAELAEQAEEETTTPSEHGGPPEMELLPYESYDYACLFFRDSRDFIAACDLLGIGRVSVPPYVGSKKIGLGRVLDGAKWLAKMRQQDDELRRLRAAQEPVPVAVQK